MHYPDKVTSPSAGIQHRVHNLRLCTRCRKSRFCEVRKFCLWETIVTLCLTSPKAMLAGASVTITRLDSFDSFDSFSLKKTTRVPTIVSLWETMVTLCLTKKGYNIAVAFGYVRDVRRRC